jgi:hypothetical protein
MLYQEIQGEGDVGPEHREGQHELPDGPEVVGLEQALQVAAGVEPELDQDPEGERPAHAVGEVPDAVHGREPVVLQALEPVDGGGGQAEGEDGDPEAGGAAVHPAPARVAVRVLCEGGAPQAGRDPDPEGEEADREDDEERQVEEGALLDPQEVVLDRVAADQLVVRVHPGPDEVLGAEAGGQDEGRKQEEEPREGRHAVLVLAAQHRRPGGVEDVVDQDHHQHPDRDGGPEAATAWAVETRSPAAVAAMPATPIQRALEGSGFVI